jgi:hypothetical protein
MVWGMTGGPFVDCARGKATGGVFAAATFVPGLDEVGPIAKGAAATTGEKLLSAETKALSEAHITNSGDTVLGSLPGYIDKANARGASYFDIGDHWNALTEDQRCAANT